MMHFISIFIFTYVTSIANGNKQIYYSNFKFEKIVFGPEDVIEDYLTLADDPNGNLPESYTVCSSVFVKYATSDIAVIQMLKQDGTPWYSLVISGSKNYDKMSENLELSFDNPTTGKFELDFITSSHIPIVPHSWYHICMGLDTVSGLLRIVVNGRLVVSEEKDYFRGTTHWKPATVQGNILQFKGYMSGFWYLHRSTFSNFNIFNSVMSVEDMETRTSGGDTCSSPGDYLRCFSIL